MSGSTTRNHHFPTANLGLGAVRVEIFSKMRSPLNFRVPSVFGGLRLLGSAGSGAHQNVSPKIIQHVFSTIQCHVGGERFPGINQIISRNPYKKLVSRYVYTLAWLDGSAIPHWPGKARVQCGRLNESKNQTLQSL